MRHERHFIPYHKARMQRIFEKARAARERGELPNVGPRSDAISVLQEMANQKTIGLCQRARKAGLQLHQTANLMCHHRRVFSKAELKAMYDRGDLLCRIRTSDAPVAAKKWNRVA